MNDSSSFDSIREAQRSVGEQLRRPEAKSGTHDWSAQPRAMVDEPELDGDPHGLAVLAVVLGEILLVIFLVVCAVLGALLLQRAVRDAVASGWSLHVLMESLHDRLGPA